MNVPCAKTIDPIREVKSTAKMRSHRAACKKFYNVMPHVGRANRLNAFRMEPSQDENDVGRVMAVSNAGTRLRNLSARPHRFLLRCFHPFRTTKRRATQMTAEFLKNLESGKKLSLDAVMPQVYDELHRLAASYMRNERGEHTLQPTALVNEAYLRLIGQHSVDFTNRAQLLGVAAQMMRRILRTHDEGRNANKRGGDVTMICLSDAPEPAAAPALAFDEVDEVLDRLAELYERQAKVAELRIFGGLTVEETAEFLNVSVETAR